MACKRVHPPCVAETAMMNKRCRLEVGFDPSQNVMAGTEEAACCSHQRFDSLPDDVLPIIFSALAKSATCPSDFFSVASLCRKTREASRLPSVLANLSAEAMLTSAERVSEPYLAFLQRCCEAGNAEACHISGMLHFYCLGSRKDGVKLLVRAARVGHADSLYSLAVIHFNGSGGISGDRKLSVGVLMCANAAQMGHVQALRELGHCFQDGYGIKRNVAEGRRLLMEANLREIVASHAASEGSGSAESQAQAERLELFLKSMKSVVPLLNHEDVQGRVTELAASPKGVPEINQGTERVSEAEELQATPGTPPVHREAPGKGLEEPAAQAQPGQEVPAAAASGEAASRTLLQSLCQCLQPLMSDWGCIAPATGVPKIQKFLSQWSELHGPSSRGEGTKVCANVLCGRWETRAREFRCCALCSEPSYCSRACQASDWRAGHMAQCQPCCDSPQLQH